MTFARKVLGQQKPSAATLTDLYTVPAATQAWVSTITAANESATPTAIRLSVAPAGAADATSQYLAYDLPIGANETITFSLGQGLAATDKIRCYNTLATVAFTANGGEIT
jgi:hypothetical protein